MAFLELIPSSARSTASVAAPLPAQLAPLLRAKLERVKDLLTRILPTSKQRNALEEAEWETGESDDVGFEREMRLQGALFRTWQTMTY
jgi:ATPase family AAA domain-containing protein 2